MDPHQVELKAEPSYTLGQQIGEGIRLNVVVIDDRDQRVVGQRDVGAIGSDITSPQLMNFLQRQVTEGFQRHGFVLVSDNGLAHAKVIAKRLTRVASGNLGDIASVGGGVSEMRIFAGQGYRIYFTMRRGVVILLLCGGDKSSQTRDIKKAKEIMKSIDEV